MKLKKKFLKISSNVKVGKIAFSNFLTMNVLFSNKKVIQAYLKLEQNLV